VNCAKARITGKHGGAPDSSNEESKRLAIEERTMTRVLRGYAKDKNGNLVLIGAIPVPISKDKCPPVARWEKRRLVRQGATIFKKEAIR
jgi:hypothetical protein